jgi:tRNA threonylcarbamoyladenosine biosynthesis protein TsaE
MMTAIAASPEAESLSGESLKDCMMTVITASPEETVRFAERMGRALKGGDIIAFKGGMGAGKTTFTRGLSIGLGLGGRVSSPTFALVNEYAADNLAMYHFDMFRVVNEEALETTGFYDYLSDDCVIVIEWSEKIEGAVARLPEVITVEIEFGGAESERIITVRGKEV